MQKSILTIILWHNQYLFGELLYFCKNRATWSVICDWRNLSWTPPLLEKDNSNMIKPLNNNTQKYQSSHLRAFRRSWIMHMHFFQTSQQNMLSIRTDVDWQYQLWHWLFCLLPQQGDLLTDLWKEWMVPTEKLILSVTCFLSTEYLILIIEVHVICRQILIYWCGSSLLMDLIIIDWLTDRWCLSASERHPHFCA